MNTASRSKTSTSGIGHLAMDEQGHADPLHRFEGRAERGDVGHPVGAVGGRVRPG